MWTSVAERKDWFIPSVSVFVHVSVDQTTWLRVCILTKNATAAVY